MSSNLAGSFAPYTPPPDDPSRKPVSRPRVWFPDRAARSYQSGGLPSSTVFSAVSPSSDIETGRHNEWETVYGLRVDVLAAFAYLLGPISALTLLILETHNDYVRFHAYQAALLMTPLLAAYILGAILQFPSWILALLTLLLLASGSSMAVQAFLGAYRGGLSRYHLPKLGFLADRWVGEE